MRTLIVNAAGFVLGALLLKHLDAVSFADYGALAWATLAFVLLSGFIHFGVQLLMIPVTFLTLGLGYFLAVGIANYFSLEVADSLVQGFSVHASIVPIILFSAVLAVVQTLFRPKTVVVVRR